MDIQITKGTDVDQIAITRADGTSANLVFPKKGLLPHDLIHLVVEMELGYTAAFWGLINDGMSPQEASGVAKAGGHASSSRAGTPDDNIVELVQAERIVECFEAELWSKPSDNDTLLSVVDAACSQSRVNSPHLTHENIENIRGELNRLLVGWGELPVGETLTICWQ